MDTLTLRAETKKMIENHLLGIDPEAIKLIQMVLDTQRSIPIRAILVHMDEFNVKQFTNLEKELIDELMYKYG